MFITYVVIGILYGIYLKGTSVQNGYFGRNAHTMRGLTILIAMIIWPIIIVIRFFSNRID